jgi:Putative Ig domain
MNRNRFRYGIAGAVLWLSFCLSAHAGLFPTALAGAADAPPPPAARQQEDSGLAIMNESPLPEASPLGSYEVRLVARGGTAPFHWRLEKGALPLGIGLEQNGLLHGAARNGGEFHFTVSVRDAGNQQARKEFVIRVHSALELKWKTMAHVDGNRIDGSVEVSNATPDDMDLTFIVLAVAPNGRATAIGYQHFTLRRGTLGQELPFGDTIARGTYVAHVDAVGEVIPKNLIYREQLQTHLLDVTVGP